MLLDKVNSFQADTLLPNEVYRALNMAQEVFIKQRYGRANKYGRGFEESQKRIDDLAPLLVDANLHTSYSQQVGDGHYRDITVLRNAGEDALPLPYMFLVSVRATLAYAGCNLIMDGEDGDYWTYGNVTDVEDVAAPEFVSNEEGINPLLARAEASDPISALSRNHAVLCKFVQNDDIFTLLKDPFNTTKLTSPIYSVSGFSGIFGSTIEDVEDVVLSVPQIEIYTDRTFFIETLHIRYIRTPEDIAADQDCQLADHTHQEIVNMAVDLLLESISDPRYKSHQAETMKSD